MSIPTSDYESLIPLTVYDYELLILDSINEESFYDPFKTDSSFFNSSIKP
jgi:hypothetical protein